MKTDQLLDGHINLNGYEAWYKNGMLHNENGPAVVDNRFDLGYKAWYLNGRQLTEQQFEDYLNES